MRKKVWTEAGTWLDRSRSHATTSSSTSAAQRWKRTTPPCAWRCEPCFHTVQEKTVDKREMLLEMWREQARLMVLIHSVQIIILLRGS